MPRFLSRQLRKVPKLAVGLIGFPGLGQIQNASGQSSCFWDRGVTDLQQICQPAGNVSAPCSCSTAYNSVCTNRADHSTRFSSPSISK